MTDQIDGKAVERQAKLVSTGTHLPSKTAAMLRALKRLRATKTPAVNK